MSTTILLPYKSRGIDNLEVPKVQVAPVWLVTAKQASKLINLFFEKVY
jgi:hypothetical protein